ncbi:MAG: Ig-like domain-containing protein, partial [Verrucomicrobiota bacterium]
MSTFSSLPPDIQNQIESLLLQADTVAGGNGLMYLAGQIVAFEEESAIQARSIGVEPEDLNPGNAPPYPVFYAATVFRPGGLFTLRGETDPFGQYSLFVPRDGTLLNVSFYDHRTKNFGIITPNLSPNARFRLPRFTLFPLADDEPDFDRDGLPDLVETVFGTDPETADSDGDGIFDGVEIDQGTNPLDGQPVRTGIVGTAKTPGAAVDVAAGNDLLAVAQGTSGVSVFNIFNGMNPVLIAHVDTPGTAQAVAMSGNLVAVADGDQGLAVIDASDPAQARIARQVRLDGNAQGVAVAGKVAYVGLSTRSDEKPGVLVAVDLVSGAILDQVSFPAGVFNGDRIGADHFHDVAVSGEEVYVLTYVALYIYGTANGRLELLARLAVAGTPSILEIGRKLFVADGLAYVGHFTGYSVIDVSNPAMPVLVGAPPTTQLSIHDLTATGSGLLLAATSFLGPQSLAVSLYDASQPADVTKFVTSFDTPGDARAVTIHNGLAYVADSAAGIQVINYQPYDGQGKPPTITLSASATNGTVEAGRTLRVTALARDDVQVRNVEFYIDGVKAFSDGNFPFEYRFEAAAFTAAKTNVTLRARAIDTGGNFIWSNDWAITLVPDKTPPQVLVIGPLGGTTSLTNLVVYFSEPMNPATLSPASFQLVAAGADGLLDTADDLQVSGGIVTYRAENFRASLDFPTPVPDGIYRGVVTTTVADQAGNRLAAEYTWQLRAANAVFWSSSMDGYWEDGFNWSTGAPPGPADNVFIESIPGDVTITLGSGTSAIKSLLVGERLMIFSSTLQVAGAVQLYQPMTFLAGTLQGGIVTENGTGKLTFTSHPANTLDAVTVNGDLDLTNSLARAVIRNGLSLTGSVVLDNTAAITFAGDQTFNTGQVIFAGFANLAIQPGTTLTLGPAMEVRGKSGVIGAGDFGTRKLINQGLIAADVAGSTIDIRSTYFENAGTFECKNGGSVSLPEGETMRNAGVINAISGGTLTLSGSWTNLGTINATAATVNLGGTFRLADLGTFNRSGGTVNLTGVLDLGGGTLTLDAVTGSWGMIAGTLKGGTVKQTGGAKLLFPGPNTINTFDGMRVEGDLELTSTSARALIRKGLSLTGSV